MKISAHEELFRQNHIRMIAIAPEMLGLEEFQAGKYWRGELFVDRSATSYGALELKKLGILRGLKELFSSASQKALDEAKAAGVTGNYKGNGFQMGGTMILGPSGDVWFQQRMENFGDQATIEEIQKAFSEKIPNWKSGPIVQFPNDAPMCNSTVCQ